MNTQVSIGEYVAAIIAEKNLKETKEEVERYLKDWRVSIQEHLYQNIMIYRNEKSMEEMLERYKEVTRLHFLIVGMDLQEFANLQISNSTCIGRVLLELLEDKWGA